MNIIALNENRDVAANKAADIIKNGGVVILPFDTVYGFACDPNKEEALKRIIGLKKRPVSKTIGLAVSNIEELIKIADLTDKQKIFITNITPGKYTFILKELNLSSSGRQRHDPEIQKNISELCTQNGTIGVRIPDSDYILEVIQKSGGIIAQTSANVSRMPNCYSINDLKKQYSSSELDKVDSIVDGGNIESAGASQIFDLTGSEAKIIERNA